MIIKWLTGLIRNKKKKEKVKVEIEELKKAILEDPKFRDEILRELEYRTGRRDVLKAGVLGLLGLSLGLGGSYAYSTVDTNTVREVVSDYAGVRIPKPCTCIIAQDGTGDYDVSPGEDASEVIQKAIDGAHRKGGGEVRIREGEYLVEKTINVGPNMHICGVGQGTKLKGNANEMIRVKSKHNLTTYFSCIENIALEGNSNNIGVKIVDSYGTIIERSIFQKFNTAVFITSESRWSEGTRLRDISIRNVTKYGILLKKVGGTGGFQGTLFCNIAINLGHDNSKGIAIYDYGGNTTFIDTQIWMKAKYVTGLYINGSCFNMYGNLRIESFEKPTVEVYAIYLDKNANIRGSFINLSAQGGPSAFTEIVKDISENSGRYVIIAGDTWYTNTRYHQIEFYATEVKKALRIGWHRKHNTFEFVTYDAVNDIWNPEDYPLTFRCPTRFEKRLQIPTSAPKRPAIGSIYFNTKSRKLYIYDGLNWRSVQLS